MSNNQNFKPESLIQLRKAISLWSFRNSNNEVPFENWRQEANDKYGEPNTWDVSDIDIGDCQNFWMTSNEYDKLYAQKLAHDLCDLPFLYTND